MKKNPDSIRVPHGLEWTLMKKLPKLTLLGLLLLLAFWGLARFLPFEGDPEKIAHTLRKVDYVLIGMATFHVTMALTVAFGCLIVMIMKGPQFTSDSYPVQDSDRPQR